MGKILRILVITGLAFLLVVASVGCAPKATPAPTPPAATPAPAPTPPAATPAPAPTPPAATPAPAPVLTLSSIAGDRVGTTTVAVNATYQLIINAIYVSATGGGGGIKVVTASSTYVSSNGSRATVTAGGLIRGIAVGAVNVTASYSEGGVTKTVVIPVTVN